MNDPSLISSLQENIRLLQKRNSELEAELSKTMEENITLQQEATRSKTLQEQLNRIIREQSNYSSSYNSNDLLDGNRAKFMDIDFDSEFSQQNQQLRAKLNEVAKERDSYMQDAAQTSMLRDLVSKKNQENLELTRKISEISQQLEILKLQQTENNGNFNNSGPSSSSSSSSSFLITSNSALQPILDDLILKNSKLSTTKVELENKITVLSKELAESKTLINFIQAENQIIDTTAAQMDQNAKMQLIEDRVKGMTEKIFSGVIEKVKEIDHKIEKAQEQIEKIRDNPNFVSKSGQNEENAELIHEIEDLKEELNELYANDVAPQLAVALKRVKELEEENGRLKKRK